jgi:hypothetical protein
MKHSSPRSSFERHSIEKLEALLVRAEREGVLAKYKDHAWTPDTFERIRLAVSASRLRQPPPVNPFRISGWRPTESDINDALADLLSPSQDYLGRQIISHILQFLFYSGDERCQLILNEISGVTCNYLVRREYPVGESRPDITIFGRSFVIFIENKIRQGTETFLQGRHQTERQSQLLQRFGDERGIPQRHRLGILLTPTGTSAKHSEIYRSLTTKDFCNVARRAILSLHNSTESKILENPRCILGLAFLWAYEDAS